MRDRGAIRVNARRTRLPVSLGVNAPVLEHVPDCVRGLPRRGQKVRVVAIGEHGAGAVHQLVEGARHPHLEPLHRAAQRLRVGRLDDAVDVVALHGELHQAEAEALAAVGEG